MRHSSYTPLSWEKEEIKGIIKKLRDEIDQLDYELGDY